MGLGIIRHFKKLAKRLPVINRVFLALENAEVENKNLKKDIEHLKKTLTDIIFYQGSQESHLAQYESGLPVPPEALRYLVAGTSDLEWFIKLGLDGAKGIEEIIKKHHMENSKNIRIHDFGCGCGRVSRHLSKMFPGGTSGSDCNSVAVNWCMRNLPDAKFFVNGFKPPLEIGNEHLDVLFSYSVFTHLSLELQDMWKNEFARVLKSGTGLLIITLHGQESAKVLNENELMQFDKGEMVIRHSEVNGSNFCATFHPKDFVIALFGNQFDLVNHTPSGSRGTPPQDLYIFRKRILN